MKSVAFTVRLPADLFEKLRSRRSSSTNAFVREALEEKIQREEDEAIRQGLLTLLDEPEDPTHWIRAQEKAWERSGA